MSSQLMNACVLCVFIQNGQYRFNDKRKFVNKYNPHYHDEALVELLYDVNDLILPNVS